MEHKVAWQEVVKGTFDGGTVEIVQLPDGLYSVMVKSVLQGTWATKAHDLAEAKSAAEAYVRGEG